MYQSTRPWKALKVAGLGERVLRQRCSIVKDPTSDEMQTFAMNLMFTCIQNNAFGISAPQVYKPVRLFVTRDYSNVPDPSALAAQDHLRLPLIPYFNPKILMKSRRMMGEYESCLSDPWNVAFVARPQTIGIGYIDGFGKYKEEELSGWHAQVFQHEFDHLEGKTMLDMCTQPGLYMTKKQYARCEEFSKQMKSLPEYETLVKASQLLNDGGYWGPEAEGNLFPEDINMDALKVQMKLFLKRFGKDDKEVTSDDFTELVSQVMNERKKQGEAQGRGLSKPTEVIVQWCVCCGYKPTVICDCCSVRMPCKDYWN